MFSTWCPDSVLACLVFPSPEEARDLFYMNSAIFGLFRFHLLVDFDDGKRSCRKRLAGHNERRRKPQLGTLSVKPHKLLHPYQGIVIWYSLINLLRKCNSISYWSQTNRYELLCFPYKKKEKPIFINLTRCVLKIYDLDGGHFYPLNNYWICIFLKQLYQDYSFHISYDIFL